MIPKMSIRNKEGIFEDFQLTDKSTKQKMPLASFWNLPEEIGAGSIQKNLLRTGLELYISDFKLREPLIGKSKYDSPAIGLNFSISGNIRYRMQCSANDDWVTESGKLKSPRYRHFF